MSDVVIPAKAGISESVGHGASSRLGRCELPRSSQPCREHGDLPNPGLRRGDALLDAS